MAGQVTPVGANAKTGKSRSTSAMGPCRKSAEENLSAKSVGQQIEHQHLPREGLGGGNTSFFPGSHQKNMLCQLGQRAGSLVRNANGHRATFAGFREHDV